VRAARLPVQPLARVLHAPGGGREAEVEQPRAWGDNSVSSCRSYSRAKVPGAALVRARFLWHFPYLERIQEGLDGVPRGPAGPPRPLS
jgi:hypothetical protein